MPKDAKKNVDRYKVAGGHLNEFEFHQNQGRVRGAESPAKATVYNKAAANKKSAKPVRGATAKKLAAKKAAAAKK